ncbi:MAG: hypothetical protein Q7U04_08210, partial [Bacteriovorax sp.]|nr:hypothetical protein [Bacteriovorax sp.]
PGRMTEAEIISSHKALGIRVNETQFYKNCKITSMVSNKMRLNDAGNPVILKIKDYSFSSIAPGDFDYHFFWEDKEGLIIAAKNEKYCNLDSAELESFRIKASKERIKNQTYGNCYIPLHTDGSPDAGYCSSDFPYQIYGKSPLKNIDSACYPTFQAAIDSSKISKYCNMSDSELIELQNKTNAEFEASRSYGKCYVEKSTALGCGEKYPWFILNKELNKSVNGFCFSEPSGAIRDIKKQAQCAP